MRAARGLIPAHAGKTMVVLPGRRAFRAHPRSRGENSVSGPPACAARGSSPLTRGKRDRLPDLRRKPGLIPAHAGKTTATLCAANSSPAHPRSRGENQAAAIEEQKAKGSSPLTRGKLTAAEYRETYERLIPAHAGKTHVRVGAGRRPRAHPRSRGEN